MNKQNLKEINKLFTELEKNSLKNKKETLKLLNQKIKEIKNTTPTRTEYKKEFEQLKKKIEQELNKKHEEQRKKIEQLFNQKKEQLQQLEKKINTKITTIDEFTTNQIKKIKQELQNKYETFTQDLNNAIINIEKSEETMKQGVKQLMEELQTKTNIEDTRYLRDRTDELLEEINKLKQTIKNLHEKI